MKEIIRKEILKRRKSYNRLNASKVCFDALIISNILDSFKRIGIYYPIGNEIDITSLIDYYPNKEFYMPITKGNLEFHKYTGNLIPGAYGTMEPTGEIIDRDLIDCFLIPCVGVNKDNKRLGYGKGYYDRYLEGYKGLMVGICYKVDSEIDCEFNTFDLTLDKLILG